ncbi:MAG: hypothetical protein H6610_11925 [Ignavibacteriales bacterium]|nr:hypothetical protein [Ignavibacteriales bacterium]
MWYLIIFFIVGYVIFKFNSDRNELRAKIEHKGGMRKIYPRLFAIFLNDKDAKIISEKTDEVVISWKSDYSVAQFRFFQLFNKLRIEYFARTALLGEIKNHWEFPSNTDEEFMAQTIMRDIEMKMNANYDWEGAQNKINEIINNLD